MKQIILGTAGHIDHGKTSLVKALTGIDTDRLKEEKLRGITIELGFAYLDLPSGQRLGIIDVPGHEKFIKNMVAGATGINLIGLVIAADEGIRPQTREHLDICCLLGISHGLVILNKIDMVNEEWLNLVKEDIHNYLQNTFLANAPIIPVSALTNQGIENLLNNLDSMALTIEEQSTYGPWRLPIDRVFTMKGFGTVITGTSIGGFIEVGQEVTIYPKKITAKIRGLQVYNAEVQQAHGGQRTAINLQGIEKTVIKRGDIIASYNSLQPSFWIDVELMVLKNIARPLKNRAPVRFHVGTEEVIGRIILLDRDELTPGETTYCQIHLEHAVALVAGDHYVLRSYSPVTTIAGGIILHPHPYRHKRRRQEVIHSLRKLHTGSAEEQIAIHTKLAGKCGITIKDLIRLIPLQKKDIENVLINMLAKQQLVCLDKEKNRFITINIQNYLMDEAQKLLSNFHTKYPLKPGMSREEFRQRLTNTIDSKLYAHLLHKLINEGRVIVKNDIIRLVSHQIYLQKDEQLLRQRIEEIYHSSGFTPPWYKEFINAEQDKSQIKKLLPVLINEGILIKIKEELYYHCEPLAILKNKLLTYFSNHERISAAQFKELTGLSRKYLIPLLEYFDTIQLTIRIGNERILRKK